MPAIKRIKTKYPGVYYIDSVIAGTNKPDKIYYIVYRREGKLIEEKAGRQSTEDMTPARASAKRIARIEGKELSNRAQRNRDTGQWTLNRIWEEYKKQKEGPRGFISDRCRYELYLAPKLGNVVPANLLQLDIDRLRITLLKVKSPQTVKHTLALLRRLTNFGFNKGLCPALQFRIELPRVDNSKTEDLDPKQLERLLKAIQASTHRIAPKMMLLALYSGMRRGEMFKLQWKDIDFKSGFVHLIAPKGKVDQKIPLNAPARKVFESLPRTSAYVFPGKDGKRLVDIGRPVNKIKAAAKLPKDFRPLHGLRHVYASMLASSGQVDMYTLQKLLTHKNPQMTQRYAHLRDDALKNAADLAGDIITRAINKK